MVTNSSGGSVPNDQESVNNHPLVQDNQPLHISNIQTTFLPSFTSPLEIAFTQLNPDFLYIHSKYVLINPTNSQIPQTHPRTNLNIPFNPQGPHHHIMESFVLDTAFQWKPAMDEQSATIDKDLLRRLDRFDEFMKKNQRLSKHGR